MHGKVENLAPIVRTRYNIIARHLQLRQTPDADSARNAQAVVAALTKTYETP
jgi:hypothetical protein